jgi:hypothetical protein
MKLAIVHGELVEQRAEELGDEEDEVDPHFLSSSFQTAFQIWNL